MFFKFMYDSKEDEMMSREHARKVVLWLIAFTFAVAIFRYDTNSFRYGIQNFLKYENFETELFTTMVIKKNQRGEWEHFVKTSYKKCFASLSGLTNVGVSNTSCNVFKYGNFVGKIMDKVEFPMYRSATYHDIMAFGDEQPSPPSGKLGLNKTIWKPSGYRYVRVK